MSKETDFWCETHSMREISERLEQLEQKLADAEKQNEWIACSDRLPEDDGGVYITYGRTTYKTTNQIEGKPETAITDYIYLINSDIFKPYLGCRGEVWESEYQADWTVTHWKPITPPQEAK